MNENSNSSRPPTHEAFWYKDLLDAGGGCVCVARFKSGGSRVEAGVFMVDTYCLGVKNAFYVMCDAADYASRIRRAYEARFEVVNVKPACARKLIEEAVRYAANLGFAPHPDYKKAARVFGGVRAEECETRFTFGDKGKPLYISGPNDTDADITRILAQLNRRCGDGNYHYVTNMPQD